MFNSTTQFKHTKRTFLGSFSNTSFPLTYDEWNAVDADLKAAALFINFYREITSAWGHFPNATITPDMAVSVIMEKLIYNVPLIESDAERYTSEYVGTVAIRCIISAVRGKGRNYVFENESSNFVYDPEKEEDIDIYDLTPVEPEPYEVTSATESLWAIIEGMGPKAEKVANHLITGDSLRRTRPDVIDYKGDRLADVSVTAAEFKEIKSQIQKNIAHLAYAFDF